MLQPLKLNPNDIIRRIMTVVNNNADLLPASLELNGSTLQLKLFDETILSADLSSLGGNPVGDGIEEATDSAMGLVRYATTEELSRIDAGVAVDPQGVLSIFNQLMGLGGTGEDEPLKGINAVLNVDPKALIELFLNSGLQVKAGGKNDKNEDVRFRITDLPEAINTGDYQLLAWHKELKEIHGASWAFAGSRLGGSLPEPLPNPGAPIFPAIADRQYASGAGITIPIPRVTKSNGSPYPLAGTYSVIEGPSWLKLSGSQTLIGSYSTTTAYSAPVTVQFVVNDPPAGLLDYKCTYTFQLGILPASVPTYPQPQIAPISAYNATQGQALTIPLTVTYPAGVPLKAGKFRAKVALPTGISINENSGVISGTPVSAGSFSTTIEFTDVDNQKSEISFQIIVAAAPVSANILAATYTWDVNTQAATWFFKLQNVTKAELGVQTPSGIVRLGQYNGKALSSDPGSADFRLLLEAGSFDDGHNWKGGFYPFSLSPLTGGLGKGEKEKLYLWLNDSGTPSIFWIITDPSVNKGLTPLLTTEPDGGTSTGNPPIPPAVDPQSVTVGESFRHEFNLFTDADAGDVVSYPTISGAPAGITAEFDSDKQKLVVRGTAQAAGTFTITFVGQDTTGKKGYLYVNYTAVAATSQITAIYRKVTLINTPVVISGSSTVVTTANVSFGAVMSGSQTIQVQANRASLPQNNDWDTITRGSDGRFGFTFSNVAAGDVLTIKFRITGQTAEIVLTYTVATPLANNSTAEVKAWPAEAPAIGYTERIISTWTN